MTDVMTLIEYAKQYSINLTTKQAKQLLNNMKLVLEINQKMNLTAITDLDEFIDKNLIDSLLCPLDGGKYPLKVLDVGTGGGFPGVPLAICYPEHQFTLMDATSKKIDALEKITDHLELSNVSFLTGRAEDFAHLESHREQYDVVVSRGVASYPILLELCTPFLKPGATFYAWKGIRYKEEIQLAESALVTLNMSIKIIKKELLMKSDRVHVIISAEKNGHTPEKYPRNFSSIKKKPL